MIKLDAYKISNIICHALKLISNLFRKIKQSQTCVYHKELLVAPNIFNIFIHTLEYRKRHCNGTYTKYSMVKRQHNKKYD